MSKTSQKKKKLFLAFRVVVVLLLLGGFVLQTMEFLFLYWTYPTVVDIQQSSPFYFDVPAFTFCNRIGYQYSYICNIDPEFTGCPSPLFNSIIGDILCKRYPQVCYNNSLPSDFQVIFYKKFMEKFTLTPDQYFRLPVPLEKYLNCTIEFAGNVSFCNLENVLGSFYSEDDLPQFCFTIYSLWGKPNATRERIPKGSTMRFHLFLNGSQRTLEEYNTGEWVGPKHNPPSDPSVQVAVHSPYFLPSPYMEGTSFIGGKKYELRIQLNERHLLPLPYQTNCTDYMTLWKERGGKAPINQLGVIQECRLNATFAVLGCIPVDFDYPHTYNICRTCGRKDIDCPYVEPKNDCARLADSYNQPCFSMTYEVEKEDKVIVLFEEIKTRWLDAGNGIRISLLRHECDGVKVSRLECSTIDIDVPFDRFEITNITFNAKFESLELFSVIGGYMGMWLGISLLAVFDLFADIIVMLRSFIIKRNRRRPLKSKRSSNRVQDMSYVWRTA